MDKRITPWVLMKGFAIHAVALNCFELARVLWFARGFANRLSRWNNRYIFEHFKGQPKLLIGEFADGGRDDIA